MYMLTVTMLSGAQLGFQYKEEMRGVGQAELLIDAMGGDADLVNITDDFGRNATLNVSEVAATLAGDFAESLVGNVEASIIQARAQADAAAKVQADPKLRFMQQMAMPAGGGFKI